MLWHLFYFYLLYQYLRELQFQLAVKKKVPAYPQEAMTLLTVVSIRAWPIHVVKVNSWWHWEPRTKSVRANSDEGTDVRHPQRSGRCHTTWEQPLQYGNFARGQSYLRNKWLSYNWPQRHTSACFNLQSRVFSNYLKYSVLFDFDWFENGTDCLHQVHTRWINHRLSGPESQSQETALFLNFLGLRRVKMFCINEAFPVYSLSYCPSWAWGRKHFLKA